MCYLLKHNLYLDGFIEHSLIEKRVLIGHRFGKRCLFQQKGNYSQKKAVPPDKRALFYPRMVAFPKRALFWWPWATIFQKKKVEEEEEQQDEDQEQEEKEEQEEREEEQEENLPDQGRESPSSSCYMAYWHSKRNVQSSDLRFDSFHHLKNFK